MTVFIRDMKNLNTEQLLAIYRDENREKGSEYYPDVSPAAQLIQAENDFLSYLREDFFRQTDAFYALLEEENEYCAAVRLEPFQDGLLLEGIATIPNKRNQGYATRLLLDVLDYLRTTQYTRVYAHVAKKNIPSHKLHTKCGFSVISDCATFVDGTVSNQSNTLCCCL